ncbi:MAG TPA: hypothetical protein VKY37_10970, partial [Brumimicrobium sp.]|nr:hypothetical protein [Brumimicrobium sp.]
DSCLYMYSGANWISLGGVGNDCPCGNTSTDPTNPPSTYSCGKDLTTQVVDVINPATGKTWVDRDLGASQQTTSVYDPAAYGDFYQWGRCSDGHEKRTSPVSLTQSSTDTPANSAFILESTPSKDWRSPANNNLWQGEAGINNLCPSGYRLPTSIELENERLTWTTNDELGAFDSPLKISDNGFRSSTTGISFSQINGSGLWSSTVNGAEADYLGISYGSTNVMVSARAGGIAIRCIKD